MTVKGIEVAGTIYDNEDETARSTATEAASTARTASQTATQASETATTASQTATEASQKADEMYEAFPSNASDSNKLVTQSDALIYYQSDSSSITDFNSAIPQTSKGAIQMFYLGSNITNAPTSSGGGFIVVAEQLSATYISQLATQIGTNNKYTRSKSGSSWSAWQKLVTENDLYADETTVTVTSDSSGSGSSSNITLQRGGYPYYVIAAGNNFGYAMWIVLPAYSISQIIKLGGESTVTCTHVSTANGKPTIQVGIVNQPNVSIQFQIKPIR